MDKGRVIRNVLVIARSARMLAQLANDSGFCSVAVDCYADEDTQGMTLETIKVSSLALRDVQAALIAVRNKYALTHVVYGSGLEHYLETLDYLERHWRLLGNSPAIFRSYQNKPAFFDQLAELGIPFPETVFSPPTQKGHWLLKPARSEGGLEISRYGSAVVAEAGAWYWQRYLPGQPMSVLFSVSQGKVGILGFNRQWTTEIDGKHPFMFAGVVNRAQLSELNRRQLLDWLTKLAGVYSLKGFASLDFILFDGKCYLLEINPRIPASAQLYGDSAFSWHVKACHDELAASDFGLPEPKAYQIIFATDSLTVPYDVNWPNWAIDRPVGGSFISKGHPICSIIASGKCAEQVMNTLRRRQNFIEKLFKTGL
ncbi:MAG: ATP-grasp domain-containing protein [Gammaproteobacteria bacterium]